MAERLDPAAARARIDSFGPEVIVALVGSVSWDEDRPFLADQAAHGRRVIATGDVLHEASEQRLAEEPWLEAALHLFSNEDVLTYLSGDRERIEDMTVRDAAGAPERLMRLERKKRKGGFRVPRPRHELFPTDGYHFSFARSKRFATLLTDYDCPYHCTFCMIGLRDRHPGFPDAAGRRRAGGDRRAARARGEGAVLHGPVPLRRLTLPPQHRVK
ncbi:hypothetical protein [Engelhardtia mirabilis]|uniref:Radical SAM superfamily protein n=1 Tax=Engelhardtia mirabilis TaxID=2528011 RepID=A0A518BDC9_9BACT|nr:hypothetical protein Pla133_00510 [Planctomycetes bacterium Pla133]QDU99315.1 hypothetical protein Pla86_00510 [Planctomycetes bacterium Pla86]